MAQTTICIRIDTDVKKRIRNILRLHRHEHGKRKINQCIEKAPDLCYPFFISLGL